jgi:hypothetical protein
MLVITKQIKFSPVISKLLRKYKIFKSQTIRNIMENDSEVWIEENPKKTNKVVFNVLPSNRIKKKIYTPKATTNINKKDNRVKKIEKKKVDTKGSKYIMNVTKKIVNNRSTKLSKSNRVKPIKCINDYFDCIYVISTSRTNNLSGLLTKLDISHINVPSIINDNIQREYKKYNESYDNIREFIEVRTTLDILKKSKINRHNRILILDSNVYIKYNLLSIVSVLRGIHKDWDLLYLGTSRKDKSLIKIEKVDNIRGTYE